MRPLPALAAAALLLAPLAAQDPRPVDPPGAGLLGDAGRVRVELRGQPVGELRWAEQPRPIFYPLLGPTGVPLTRAFPLEQKEGEAQDHPHHRSLWFAHGDVNGIDFWSEGEGKGRIEVVRTTGQSTAADRAEYGLHCRWLGPDGEAVCEDERVLRFRRDRDAILIDWDLTLRATQRDVRLGDTKEGTMALRLRPELALRGKGHYRSSTGLEDAAVWGKRAAWVDAYGEVDGQVVGVAILDWPGNHAHPTWWHARDYGLFAANPFGVHDFERKPPGTGDVRLAKGESLRLRYRIVLHDGDAAQAGIEARFRDWIDEDEK